MGITARNESGKKSKKNTGSKEGLKKKNHARDMERKTRDGHPSNRLESTKLTV